MPMHVVRQGEHLSGIAERYGLTNDEIWIDSRNEALRGRRANPHMLAPGDLIAVPESAARGAAPVQVQSVNRFRAHVPRVAVAILLRREDEPIAGEAFEVHGAGAPIHGTTEADGRAGFEVPVFTREVRLVVPGAELEYTIRVGGLDPIEEDSGVHQRLAHLGFSAEPEHAAETSGGWHSADRNQPEDTDSTGSEQWIPEALQRDPRTRAIAVFQHAQGITVTGTMDDATRDALRRAYGS